MTDEHLYPAIEPYDCGMLDVESPHRLYYEQSGNPYGIPVVFLHGGPGSGCAPAHRRFFDPRRYRIVLFDQRGAGRSEPAACIENNSTQSLVNDLELLRAHLRIERWLLYGGSWGATLALLYVQRHVERVSGMVLRGVFLARARDVIWVYGGDGVARLFPREYELFITHLAPADRASPVAAYRRLFMDDDAAIREAAACQWNAWESRVVRQFLSPEPEARPLDMQEMLRRARIVSHFAANDFFLGGKGMPLQFDRMSKIPSLIVHGQRDLVCPLEAAWTLHGALPNSELRIVEEGGHVASEPPIGRALVAAFDEMAGRLST
jgi:proline iminopeptidase